MAHRMQMSEADTGLLVIDVQEKLLTLIPQGPSVVRNISFLVDAARILGMTIQATEQYPRGLGPTVPDLASRLPARPEKTTFSCCAIDSVVEAFHLAARPKIVLTGLETHVCVLNTALDFLALDFQVFIPVDGVAARYRLDHETALRRLEQAGAILTTTEGCVFEWLGEASHPRFKEISRLVQERMKWLAGDGSAT